MSHGLISPVGSTVYRQFNCIKLVEIRPLSLAFYGTAVIEFMMSKILTDQLLHDPDLLAMTIDRDAVRFARVSNETYYNSAFLDHRMSPPPSEAIKIRLDVFPELDSIAKYDQKDLIIAHTGFCSSTLLSRLINSTDMLVLREPQILSYVSNYYRMEKSRISENDRLMTLALRLLGKKYSKNQTLVLKLSNYSNNLIDKIMDYEDKPNLLIIIGCLDELMISMKLHEAEARINLPKFIMALQMDVNDHPRLTNAHVMSLDTYQQAALLWSLQISVISAAVEKYRSRSLKLHSSDILKRINSVITSIDKLLMINRDESERENLVSRLLHNDAKSTETKDYTNNKNKRDTIRKQSLINRSNAISWAKAEGLCLDGSISNIPYLI